MMGGMKAKYNHIQQIELYQSCKKTTINAQFLKTKPINIREYVCKHNTLLLWNPTVWDSVMGRVWNCVRERVWRCIFEEGRWLT